MSNYNKILLMIFLTFIVSYSWSQESTLYSQRTLPNGDVEVSYSAGDGSKVMSVQHNDGSVETTSIAASGSKSVSIQHADGSIDTHVTKTTQE